MKKQNGFIATSLIYTFFLAFIALFVGLLAVYLQNRVYLIKLDDSSKKSIYIRELEDFVNAGSSYYDTTYGQFHKKDGNCFAPGGGGGTTCYNLTMCEKIYKSTHKDDETNETITFFHLEGCEEE